MEQFTLRLDPETRDLVFDEAGILETVEGDGATAQNVTNTLNAWKGEFFLEGTHGTDYSRILGRDSYDVLDGEADDVFREAIFQESRVTVIRSLEVSISGRDLDASFQAELADGTQIVKEGGGVVTLG